MNDKRKGRRGFSRGEIIEMRRAANWGHSAVEIGKAWGISGTAARDIIKERSYRDVLDDAPGTPPKPLPSREERAQLQRRRVMNPKDVPGPDEAAAQPTRGARPVSDRPSSSPKPVKTPGHLSEYGMTGIPIPKGE